MDIRITPGRLRGSIPAIPSKSDVHRLLICAALADRPTVIDCPAVSQDIEATVRCLVSLGAKISYSGGTFSVTPIENVPEKPLLDCGESGSTLRFLLPVAAAVSSEVSFSGRGRLPDRPIGELTAEMRAHGAVFSAEKLPFTVSGGISGGTFTLPGNVSSQYITGLLLALPLLGGGEVRLTTELESASYVDMTVNSMAKFGVSVGKNGSVFTVSGAKYRSPGAIKADGDWSNAAFFIVAGCSVTGLDANSPQGDRVICENMDKILRGESPDLRDTPDMLPALAVFAAMNGGAEFRGIERLRIKESDRIASVRDMIRGLGGAAYETGAGLRVENLPLTGGEVDACGDHRIAMAAAVAASMSAKGALIRGAEAVNKSYPSFFEDLKKLGGAADVV